MKKGFSIPLVVALSLSAFGCVEQRQEINFSGIGGIDAMKQLEPRLAADPNPQFFAPWLLDSRLRPLTDDERLALNVHLNIQFRPDELGVKTIESQFALLTQPLRPRIERWLVHSEGRMPLVRQVLAENGLPEELAYLPFIESGFSPDALSSAGARGIWQFMPETGRRFGLACCDDADERVDPIKSSLSAAAYLRTLYRQFGDWSLAIAAYNAGEGRISRAVAETGAKDFFELARANAGMPPEKRLATETLLYVPRFIAMTKIIKNLDCLGFERPTWYRG